MLSVVLCKCRQACRGQRRDVGAGACEMQCTTEVRKGGRGGACEAEVEKGARVAKRSNEGRLDVTDVSER